jgi:type I restriction enzyme S subunit
VLRAGDVVVVRTGQAGVAAVVPTELHGANCIDLLIIRPNTIDPHYLVRVLNSDWTQKHIGKHSVGTIQSHFNLSALGDLPLPLPDLETQQSLVQELAGIAGKLDDTIERIKTQVRLLEEHRQALITAAVTGELEVTGRHEGK